VNNKDREYIGFVLSEYDTVTEIRYLQWTEELSLNTMGLKRSGADLMKLIN